MAKKSASATPSRSSERAGKQTSIFQVVHASPKKRSAGRPKKSTSDTDSSKSSKKASFKKIVDHRLFNNVYVEYSVQLSNGSKIWATEFDFKNKPKLLSDYKFKITNQEDDDDEDYVVEKILAHRYVKGKKDPLYLVMWRGFPNPVSHTEMWESELGNCSELIDAYKASTDMKPPKLRKSGGSSKSPKKSSKKSSKKSKRTDEGDDDEDNEDEPEEKHKKSKKSKKPSSSKKRAVSESDDEEEEEEEERPVKKSKGKKRLASESGDEEESPSKKSKSSKKAKKSAPVVELSDDDDEEDNEEEKDEDDNESNASESGDDDNDDETSSKNRKKRSSRH